MERFISTSRRRSSSAKHASLPDTAENLLIATQSDRARLIYSAAFRRLQQKAQVFSLENNSSVRSRLTHSIEVSHIGRYIVAKINEKLTTNKKINEKEKNFWIENSLAISNIVETACLMHDIGNPPFGHLGEAAIIEWSNSDEILAAMKNSLGKEQDELLSDFNNFDGNPQGLRVITRLQGDDGYYGLNLTYTQLASFLKYTYCSKNIDKEKPFSKKTGYFSTEKEIIEETWGKINLPPHTRHPLGYLMEASDDISYCISDIEDGIEKKIITLDHFKEFTKNELIKLKDSKFKNDAAGVCDELIKILNNEKNLPISNFLSFKTYLSNTLVDRAAIAFIENYDEFIEQRRHKSLISDDTFEFFLLKILKDYTAMNVFTSSDAECMELSGFSIVKGILTEYTKLLSLKKEEFFFLLTKDNKEISNKKFHIERRLFNRLPTKHIDAYKTSILKLPTNDSEYNNDNLKNKLIKTDKETEWNLRAHLIVDFVSGMTDLFSMDMYQLLKGIRVK
ncbi:dGTPase [Lonsdalea quercina]|uniref:dGTPase n=1 Tax=Lonsdalea quercina TaxID=71657 RepID=UPI00397594B2